MRFNLLSTERPGRVAKRLRGLLTKEDLRLSHAQALEVTARLYGYRNWHDLTTSAGKEPVSLDDTECAPELVAARRDHQVETLTDYGIRPDRAGLIVDALHPTGTIRRRSKADMVTLLSDLLELHQADTAHFDRGKTEVAIRSSGIMAKHEPYSLDFVDEIFSLFSPNGESSWVRHEPIPEHPYVGQLLVACFGDNPNHLAFSRRGGPGESGAKQRKLSVPM